MFDNYPPGVTSAPLSTGNPPTVNNAGMPSNVPTAQAPVDMYAQVAPSNAPARAPMMDQNSYNTMPNFAAEPVAASTGSFKFLVIGLVTLVLVLAGSFAAYQMILKPKFENATSATLSTGTALTNTDATNKVDNQSPTETQIVASDATSDTEIVYNNSTSSVTSSEAINTQTDINASSTEPTVMEQPKETDTDNDKLSDDLELLKGTNKNVADTDGDGLLDGDEVYTYGTDPLKSDTDGDGLSDGEEVMKYQTKPLIVDTDGDSFSDGQEVKNGYNPLGSGRLIVSNK